MALQRFSAWFKTDFGRSFAHGSMLFANFAGIMYHFVPQTILIDYYKDTVHLYNKGEQVPVSDALQAKFDKCMEILKFEELYKKAIKPFRVVGFDAFNVGTSNTRFGAAVGIPANFDYKTTDDIDKENIRVNLKHIDWSSEDGKKLAEALVLPENVQLFVLCREILEADSIKIYLNTVYGIFSLGFLYLMSMHCNKKLLLLERPPLVRYAFYNVIAWFSIGLYFFAKDFTTVHIEESIDEKLADVSPEFIDSGIEFYDKILKRNQALRVFMGSEGESKYSALGNENFLLRHIRKPIIRKKQYFEERKKALQAKSEMDTTD